MTEDRNAVIEREIPEWRAYLHKVANGLLDPLDPGHDDLCQEGLIAMWRAVDTHDPSRGAPLAAHMKARAVYRMRDVAADRVNLTGGDRPRVTQTDKGVAKRAAMRAYLRDRPDATLREVADALGMALATASYHRQRLHDDVEGPPRTVSWDVLLDAGFDPTAAGDLLDHVIEEYHHGRVAEALSVLTAAQRRYVVLRFWHGMQAAELRAAFGYDPHSLWRGARERLRPVLADLVAA